MAFAVVTGSASGIGLAVRRRLTAQGFDLVGVDLHDAEVTADLSTPEGRSTAITEILERTGGDVARAVLCAGLGPTSAPAPVILGVNYFGAIALLDGLGAALDAGDGANVVVIASNSATAIPGLPEPLIDAMLSGDHQRTAELGGSVDGHTAYAASKLAVARAVRRRAPELASRRVRLNAVAPGPIETPLLQAGLDDPETGPLIRDFPVPTGAFGKPDDVAAAVEYLLGADAAYICGSVLFIDGGTDALLRPDSF